MLLLTGFKSDTLYRIVLSLLYAAFHYVMARICRSLCGRLLSPELLTGLLQYALCWLGGSIWYHSGLAKPVFYRFEDFIWQGDCWKVSFAVGGGRILTRVWESLETHTVVSVILTGFMTCQRCVHHEGCSISKVP